MPRKVFTAGEILTAANLNDVSDQSVMVFDDDAARTTAIPTPVEGMVTYLKDTNEVSAFTGSAFTAVGPGKILQVVSTFKDDTFTMSSATFSDVTGLTVSITPISTGSKVLVMVTLNTSVNNALGQASARLLRGATVIGAGAAAGSRTPGSLDTRLGPDQIGTSNIIFLDSPNTTSSTAYKIQVRMNTANTVAVNRRVNDTDSAAVGRTASTITVMEVAG